jgi:3-phytase
MCKLLRALVTVGTILTTTLSTTAALPCLGGEEPSVAPVAKVQTEPVPSQGDAADDPAIWIHPVDSALSLVLGTDTKGGLNVFDPDGKCLQIVSNGARPNNVDVLYDVPLPVGKLDLAIAGTRSKVAPGVSIWYIDAQTRRLSELGPVPAFPVFGGGEPYGSCVYRSPRDRAYYVFITSKEGNVEQYRLQLVDKNAVRGALVRTLHVGSTNEGCVADFDLGWLYISEEDVGIWKYGAGPDNGSTRTLVARIGEHGLKPDVEGLTIYYATGTKGYLIASSQGASTFKVYERDGANAFVLTVDPGGGSDLDVAGSDGIDVTNAPTSNRFPRGFFVCQDGRQRQGRQNFKLFAWEDIAGDRLLIDTTRSAR